MLITVKPSSACDKKEKRVRIAVVSYQEFSFHFRIILCGHLEANDCKPQLQLLELVSVSPKQETVKFANES